MHIKEKSLSAKHAAEIFNYQHNCYSMKKYPILHRFFHALYVLKNSPTNHIWIITRIEVTNREIWKFRVLIQAAWLFSHSKTTWKCIWSNTPETSCMSERNVTKHLSGLKEWNDTKQPIQERKGISVQFAPMTHMILYFLNGMYSGILEKNVTNVNPVRKHSCCCQVEIAITRMFISRLNHSSVISVTSFPFQAIKIFQDIKGNMEMNL